MATWTEEEESILVEEWEKHLACKKENVYEHISQVLSESGFTRTPTSVESKRKRMGLDSTYSSESDDNKSDNLSSVDKHFISLLPATKKEIVESLGISESTFDHLKKHLREDIDVKVEYDHESEMYHLVDQPKKRRLSTKHKGTITREANQFRTEAEADVLRRLSKKPPLESGQDPAEGNEDLVFALSDIHWGDVVENQYGEEVYNSDIASASVIWAAKKALRFKKRHEEFTEFDTIHFVIGGDIITNEMIYDGQAFDIDIMMGDQLSLAIEHLLHVAETLAECADTLQIVAVPGNHGEIRSSYNSKQANLDLTLYRNLIDRLIDRGYDNIAAHVGEAKHYRKFELRGGKWSMLLHHGHNEKLHVDSTASSQASDRGNVVKYDVDGFIRGHYHTQRYTEIMNQFPVIQLPSPKKGGDFAEKIGRPDCSVRRNLGAVWRCSDDRLMSSYPMFIDDIGMHEAIENGDIEYTTKSEIRNRYNNPL